MTDRVIRLGFLLVVTFATWILAQYCWTRASIGRYAYHITAGIAPTILDTKTGTVYVLSQGKWQVVGGPVGEAKKTN
jgi:hypothetical protein